MAERNITEVIQMDAQNRSTPRRRRECLLPNTNSEKRGLSEFIYRNLTNRVCCCYIQDRKGNGKEICCCGRDRSQHEDFDTTDGGYREWSPSSHTKAFPSNTFGEICFGGFGHIPDSLPPYVRVSHDTDVTTLWTLLSDHWHLKPPKLLISVTGGAKNFYMKPQLLSTFKRGVIKAATSTGAWIVTGGSNAGVMKYVGEAVREHVITTGMAERQMVAIGVATWGIVDNKNALIGTLSEQNRGKFPAAYDINDLNPDRVNTCALDHNHTHFILVDDGTEKKYGAEIKLRASLEEHISKLNLIAGDESLKIPVVLLVLEGGTNTLETAAVAVKKNIPVVVVQGSGRAADLIAEFCGKNGSLQSADGSRARGDEKDIKKRAYVKFKDENRPIEDETLKKAATNIKILIEKDKESLITVINLDEQGSATEIDQAILHALLQSRKSNVRSQLDLALAWNRSDIARTQIFTVENRPEWKGLDLNEAMFTALDGDMVEFVQLFLDCGVDLKKFVTHEKLVELYSKVIFNSCPGTTANLLEHLLQTQQKSREDKLPLKDIGQLVSYLMVAQFKNIYAENGASKTRISEHAEWHLFLWATLLNRRDLAFLFWKNGKDPIGCALRASAVLKNLAQEAEKQEEGDLSISLRTNSQFFETLSVGVLNECYKRDKNKAHKLLVRPQEMFNKSPLLALADAAQHMDFMGHSCCQTKLICVWMGKIALYTPLWKIIAAMFLPLLLFSIKFSTNEPPDMSEERVDRSDKETACWKRRSLTRKPHGVSFRNTPETINIFQALLYYHTAPIVKFLYHTLAYVIFLNVFSFFILTDLHPISSTHSPGICEYITWIWAGSMLIEEFRQMITRNPGSPKMSGFFAVRKANLSQYFSSFWNWLDLGIYLMLLTSIVLRLRLPASTFIWAQSFYAITLVLCFMRFLNVFFVWEKIGPKVIMIKEMLYDLASFIIIMGTFLLAYGISAHALQFPNSLARWELLRFVMYHPYWNIYGELSLDKLEGNVNGCPANGTVDSSDPNWKLCPRKSWLVLMLFAIYMILTHVLLLNLLIAMFSYTFQKVQNQSRKVWKYHRYTLIDEYLDRPTLAPPLIYFNFIFRLVKFVSYVIISKGSMKQKLIKEVSPEENNRLTMFERAGMEDYILNTPHIGKEHAEPCSPRSFGSGISSEVICRMERQLAKQCAQLAQQSEQIQQLMVKLEKLVDMHKNKNM